MRPSIVCSLCLLLMCALCVPGFGEQVANIGVERATGVHGSWVKVASGNETSIPNLPEGWFAGGPFLWTITSSTPSEYASNPFLTLPWNDGNGVNDYILSLCIDLAESVGSVYHVETDLAKVPKPHDSQNDSYPMGPERATRLRQLWANNIGTLVSKWNSNASDRFVFGDALQFAAWEIVFETPGTVTAPENWDVKTGDFRIKSVADFLYDVSEATEHPLDVANGLLVDIPKLSQVTTLNNSSSDNSNITLHAWSSPEGSGTGYQDQLVQVVPEPTSMGALLAMGLAAAPLSRLRRRRRRVATGTRDRYGH